MSNKVIYAAHTKRQPCALVSPNCFSVNCDQVTWWRQLCNLDSGQRQTTTTVHLDLFDELDAAPYHDNGEIVISRKPLVGFTA